MKNNGFTLVELLVAISILAVLTMIAIPTLRAFQNSNATKQYESYSASVASSAKLYNDSYSEDLFGNADSGCQKVMLTCSTTILMLPLLLYMLMEAARINSLNI